MNQDHSVVFEVAPKYCISDSLVDYEGYSISFKGLLPDLWSQTAWVLIPLLPFTICFISSNLFNLSALLFSHLQNKHNNNPYHTNLVCGLNDLQIFK